jgi:hypothetical protein
MKLRNLVYFLLGLFAVALSGCDNNALDAGVSTLDTEDEIRVCADTFAITSVLQEGSAINLTPDSFLLGECDTRLGTLRADLLTQLSCPEGNGYPYADRAEVDSIVLYLYYQNYYGDGYAPLGISVYELDRETMDYNTPYPSDTTTNILTFCSLDDSTRITEHTRIVIAKEPADSAYVSGDEYIPCIKIPLTDQFAKRFFSIKDFSSQEAFNQNFKGLYITSEFGGSTMLYVKEICMAVYYHVLLNRQNQPDTIVQDTKMFYANSEVRQVNRYIYPYREAVLSELQQQTDTNYISSPANIYTRLSLRMDSIRQKIRNQFGDMDKYRVYVNRANLTIDVLYSLDALSVPRDQWDQPAANMLLVKANQMESFFAKNELPSDTSAIVSSLMSQVDSLGNTSYYYSYDLSGLLTQQLRSEEELKELDLILVPVSVETTTSSTVSAIKPSQTISATHIRSANNPIQPMNIEMVYSVFNHLR